VAQCSRSGRPRGRRRRDAPRGARRLGCRWRSQPTPRRGASERDAARAGACLARAALPGSHDPTGERRMSTLAHALPTPRLVSADVLKLGKRRGLAAVVALMTVGTVVIANTVIELMHLSNPVKHGPAGGVTMLGHFAWTISALGAAAAAIVGSTA